MSQMLLEIIDIKLTNTKISLWILWAKFCRWFIFCCPDCGSLLRRCDVKACALIWCPCCTGSEFCEGWDD